MEGEYYYIQPLQTTFFCVVAGAPTSINLLKITVKSEQTKSAPALSLASLNAFFGLYTSRSILNAFFGLYTSRSMGRQRPRLS
jgi:hypothetical protein